MNGNVYFFFAADIFFAGAFAVAFGATFFAVAFVVVFFAAAIETS
jgi:hypothetical protein